MTLPGDLTTAQVTGTYLDAAGFPQQGTVRFTPSAVLADATGSVVIPMVARVYAISAQGTFTTDLLVSTDASTVTPTGWTYTVVLSIDGLTPQTWSVLLPASGTPQDISGITPVVPQAAVTAYVPQAGGSMTGLLTLDGGLQIPANAALNRVLTSDAEGNASWEAATGGISTVSVVTANGFAGTVANPTTTPALTLKTSITGLLKGNGTAVSSAVSGTDYDAAGAAATAQSTAETFATSAVTTERNRAEAAEAGLLPLAGGTVAGPLTVTGQVVISGPLQIPASAAADYVLTSDGAGNAGWGPATGGGGTITVAGGGTGDTFLTAYAPLTGGTTSTADVQQATSGMAASWGVLTSQGASALPVWGPPTLPDGTGGLWQLAVDPSGGFYTQPILQDEVYGVITDEAGSALV